MIDKVIKKHDDYRLEFKFGYKMTPDEPITGYKIEMFFFIPNNLGMNRMTYGKDAFFTDMQSHIRFITPVFLLENMTGKSDCPLDKLEKSIADLLNRKGMSQFLNYKNQIKIFSSIYRSALRDTVNYVRIHDLKEEDLATVVRGFIENSRRTLAEFRKLRDRTNVPLFSGSVFEHFLLADEYMSLMTERYSFELLSANEPKNSGNKEKIKEIVKEHIATEINYRKERGYPSIVKADSNNENLIHRIGVLKKYMASVLFLNAEIRSASYFLEQVIFFVAAGIAMLFATSIAFFSQVKYGTLTTPLFVILIISYMFKDRIKEVTRTFLSKKILTNVYDHSLKIRTSNEKHIGQCKEGFDFMEEKKVPAEIMQLRNAERIEVLDNYRGGEKVFLYRKKIRIFSKRLTGQYFNYGVEGLNDILRYNVKRLLEKMDDPEKKMTVIENGKFQTVTGERVYQFYIICKFIDKKGEDAYNRYRIVLNRNGIQRVEAV